MKPDTAKDTVERMTEADALYEGLLLLESDDDRRIREHEETGGRKRHLPPSEETDSGLAI